MDRLNRMLHAAQGMGMGMGSAAPGGVSALSLRHSRYGSVGCPCLGSLGEGQRVKLVYPLDGALNLSPKKEGN